LQIRTGDPAGTPMLSAARRSPFAVVTRLRGAAISVLLAPAQTP
jgi:hypothetical protein